MYLLPLIIIICYLFLILCVIIGVAFITLIERKILGYIQLRLGPNKIFLIGLIQPIRDAIKLFFKEKFKNGVLNNFLFNFFPFFSLILIIIFWLFYDFNNCLNRNYRILLIYIISGLGVYVVLGSGWASNSKYALLGCYRGVRQIISYEVTIAFILLRIVSLVKSFSLNEIKLFIKRANRIIFPLFFIFFFWLIVVVAELNRAPFDFAEGESELVSGFNIEYGGGSFALLFLAEYGNIFFLSYLRIFFFFSKNFLLIIFLIMGIIWIRGTYPRFRYDNLIFLVWKVLLPFSIWGLYIRLILRIWLFS